MAPALLHTVPEITVYNDRINWRRVYTEKVRQRVLCNNEEIRQTGFVQKLPGSCGRDDAPTSTTLYGNDCEHGQLKGSNTDGHVGEMEESRGILELFMESICWPSS
jgi:hypothetical protein